MIATLLSLVVLPQTGEIPKPAKLIGDMIARYYSAQALSARIRFTVTAADQTGVVDTEVQLERPTKLSIRQQQNFGRKLRSVVTADGNSVTYDAPEMVLSDERERLAEAMGPQVAIKNIQDVFTACLPGLIDRSPVLSLLIGRRVDLVAFRNQLLVLPEKAERRGFSGHEAIVIDGGWSPGDIAIDPNVPIKQQVAGSFQIVLSTAGDLERFQVSHDVRPQGSSKAIHIVETWDVLVNLSPSINPDLYKPVKRGER